MIRMCVSEIKLSHFYSWKKMSEEIIQKSEKAEEKEDDNKVENKRPLSNASLEFLEILSDVKQIALQQNGASYSDEQYYNNAKKYWHEIGEFWNWIEKGIKLKKSILKIQIPMTMGCLVVLPAYPTVTSKARPSFYNKYSVRNHLLLEHMLWIAVLASVV